MTQIAMCVLWVTGGDTTVCLRVTNPDGGKITLIGTQP